MDVPILILPAATGSPALHVHVNPLYALYHYLVHQGQHPREGRNPAMADAATAATQVRHLTGVHGVWDVWEQALAQSTTPDEAITGLMETMTESVTQLGSALRSAESEFYEQLWPERQATVQAAVTTIHDALKPWFASMAQSQAAVLELVWPDCIRAYLVTDCYDWQGGYSHPLTIDVTSHTGLTLCETLLHEATHVADVHTGEIGKENLRNRVTAMLLDEGIPPPTVWNVWHGIIFAASAYNIRSCIEPTYVDYATTHNLYQWLKVPDLPWLWAKWVGGQMNEREFLQALAAQVGNHPD
jgi:hypothetical protein